MEDKAKNKAVRDSEGLRVSTITTEEPKEETVRLVAEIDLPEETDEEVAARKQREEEEAANQANWDQFLNR